MSNAPDQSNLTPGQIIKQAREAQNISVNDAVQRLLLGKKILVALEEDDYSKIHAEVYAEGYLRAYAKFLRISPDLLIQSFRDSNLYSNKQIQKDDGVPAKNNKDALSFFQSKRARLIGVGIFVALFLAGGGFFLFNFIYKGKAAKVSAAIDSSVVKDADGLEAESTVVIINGKNEQELTNINIPLEISESKDSIKRR